MHTCLMEGGILLKPMGDYESFLPELERQSTHYFIGARRMQPESPFYDLEGNQNTKEITHSKVLLTVSLAKRLFQKEVIL